MESDDEYVDYENLDDGDFEEDDGDYTYDDEMDAEDSHSVAAAVTNKASDDLKALIPSKLIRENSSGSYFLQIPYEDYVIQTGDEASILPVLQGIVSEVSSYFGVSDDESLALLRISNYNKEKVFDRYLSDSNLFRAEAGIAEYSASFIDGQLDKLAADSDATAVDSSGHTEVLCQICYDDVPERDTFQLGCRHQYCRSCYTGHMKAKISDGLSSIGTTCPASKCRELCTYKVFRKLLSAEDRLLLARYESFLVMNFITTTQFCKYCPGKNCGRVAIGSSISTVKCDCGISFCFNCGQEAHDPCSCEQLRQWTIKSNDESENLIWIMANTQRCPNPKCDNPIEKNQGCNHMTCSQCRHEFCWICLSDWKQHNGSYYKCNKFKDEERAKTAAEEERERARRESNRYLHYFKRYQAHQSSRKHAQVLLAKVQQALAARMDSEIALAQVEREQFLITSCELLVQCRSVLMNTYIMGFYMKDDTPEKTLFEYQQALLEETTDHLQEMTKSSAAIRRRDEIIRLTDTARVFFQNVCATFIGGVARNFDVTL